MLKNHQIETSTTTPHLGGHKPKDQFVSEITSKFKTKLEISFCRCGPKLATSSEWYTSKSRSIYPNDNETSLVEKLAKFVLIGVGAELIRQASDFISLL